MRILANREDFEVCGINLRKADLDYMEYMLKYDTASSRLSRHGGA